MFQQSQSLTPLPLVFVPAFTTEMGIVTKAAACSAVLVAMVIAGVLSYRPVVQFHQYPGIQRQQAHFKPEHPEDRGYAKNCGQ